MKIMKIKTITCIQNYVFTFQRHAYLECEVKYKKTKLIKQVINVKQSIPEQNP